MNYSKRISKKEKDVNNGGLFTFNPHTLPIERNWNQGYIQFISIDPAVDNYAFRIERRYISGKIETISLWKKCLLPKGEDEKDYDIYSELTKLLDSEEKNFDNTHIILVEKQMAENYRSLRISQHTLSYFCLRLKNLPLFPEIVEMDSKLKFRILNAPKDRTKPFLKRWSVEKGIELLEKRKDEKGLSIVRYHDSQKKDKGDDLTDTIIMIEAACIIWGYPETEVYLGPKIKLVKI